MLLGSELAFSFHFRCINTVQVPCRVIQLYLHDQKTVSAPYYINANVIVDKYPRTTCEYGNHVHILCA
jgi:hypothetical protein